ncbi:conserved Plasmodium protein, unknown function [Plasmodium gallinaceum]|uniref:Peripheral plastid protein 1 n=1 Tax=Plasmodium gallinaceum TaxID=5849 RepID=A0A1J1GTM9_PLAGA|nr:conserved Plasmodium protein, unknown function [Plasmodium gallinaceum]CRG95886.1 conserved Plasmodium protein, unknown function [Plasmodium gallinaceum]
MRFFIGKTFLNILLIFLLNIYMFQGLIERNKVKFSRILNEKRFKKSEYFKFKQQYGISSRFKNYHLFINNWEGKKNKRSYKFKKHKVCSIFSNFMKKKNEENKKESKKILVNENENIDSKIINSKENIINNDEKKNNLVHDLHENKIDTKNNKLLRQEEKLNEENEKNSDNLNKENNRNVINNNSILKENVNSHNKNIMINFKDIDINSNKILKNINSYKKHLEILNEKSIISLNKIFCTYTKSLDENDDFKYFFENILKYLETNFHNYSLIGDIEKLNNEKTKKEYILNNLNYFIEVINMVDEQLFNILVFKIQFLKLKAINEIRNIISNKKYSTDYIEYSNNINNVVEKYKEQLKNLYPKNYEFNLYNKTLENYGLSLESCYKLPINKYKEFIDTNIEYINKISQDLTQKKKKNLYTEIERNKNYQSIMQIIDNQQKQIEVLQEQLESSVEGINGKYNPFHCAISYRIPDTNLNISTQYLKGKVNIKLNCIPDDSQHLLGSYGFVKSLPFGNLGLSFSLNF